MWLRVSRKQGPVMCVVMPVVILLVCYRVQIDLDLDLLGLLPLIFRVQRLLQWLCDHWSLVSLLLMFTLPRPALYCFTVASCLDRTQTRPQDHWPTPGLTVLTRVSAQLRTVLLLWDCCTRIFPRQKLKTQFVTFLHARVQVPKDPMLSPLWANFYNYTDLSL